MLSEYDKSLYDNLTTSLQKNLDHFNSELNGIRAGRANPKLLDKIMVDYYGTMTPLNKLL